MEYIEVSFYRHYCYLYRNQQPYANVTENYHENKSLTSVAIIKQDTYTPMMVDTRIYCKLTANYQGSLALM